VLELVLARKKREEKKRREESRKEPNLVSSGYQASTVDNGPKGAAEWFIIHIITQPNEVNNRKVNSHG
jgi:hypothetical protein